MAGTIRARKAPNYAIDALSDVRHRATDFEALRDPPTTRDFLERLRAKIAQRDPDHPTVTTYRLALELGCEWSTVKRWLKGEGSFSHKLAARIADELDLPAEYVVACVEHERTDEPMLKAMWARIAGAAIAAKRTVKVVAITLIAGLGLFPASRPVQAQAVSVPTMKLSAGDSYIMRTRRRLPRRRLADRLLGWLLWTPRPAPGWRPV